MSICQLQNLTKTLLITSFFATLIVGCAETPVSQTKIDEKEIKAEWNKLPPRFTLRENDTILTNPFFDIDPLIDNLKDKEVENFAIRYFVTTPAESQFQYNFDLYSGKLFLERKFCAQDDIWNNYRADLMTPNFTQGIVPRVYDENKRPMKIMVISDKEAIEPFKEKPTHFDEARILGSVVVEFCESYPCDKKNKWKASQILVGVSPRDRKLNALSSFTTLKNKIDWSYAKGMLTNMHGYHRIGGKVHAAYRISKELNLKDSVLYFNKTSSKLTSDNLIKLKDWRVGCMKLYDSIWDESEKIRAQKDGQAESFMKFFKNFYAKDSNEFYQCQQLIRPASILEDTRRTWFFSYVQAAMLLSKNGFYYSCQDNIWAYNPKVDETHYYVDQSRELEKCRTKNFESIFDQSINGMSLMKNQVNHQFRFIEYDNPIGGSHQMIYGWVPEETQNFSCKYDSKVPNQIPFEIFPQDVVWENFRQDEAKLVK